MIPRQKVEQEWDDPSEPRETNWRLVGFAILGFLVTAAFFYILNGGNI